MKKNILLKIVSAIVLLQGIFQLVNTALILGNGTSGIKISMTMFYLSLVFTLLYGIVALIGGVAGLFHGSEMDGCKKSFYCGLGLIILNIGMLFINFATGSFDVMQLEAFITPGLYTIVAVISGRSN
ncbi:hypothetical protein BHF70_01260 [Anaerostipes sp. 494a]|uniref:hypothetical protein n=1 Tax=Anaerostipes TaxID=207244 RepID=UPI000952C5F7|nr:MULTISPECIES: hypothetical protein [Anaerostipes]MCI5623285.1 hypothetical protein [Anaerostipes sp.]MDY2726598.1 hypothetical protein [Anaerostipes faecalis]OLR58371.1 hypothetical protein BHF70_01260 [Anaerostipes sp. 494a]